MDIHFDMDYTLFYRNYFGETDYYGDKYNEKAGSFRDSAERTEDL